MRPALETTEAGQGLSSLLGSSLIHDKAWCLAGGRQLSAAGYS